MKTQQIFCLILASYVLLYIQPCFSFSVSGPIITDLVNTNSAGFEAEASSWSLSNTACTSCTSQTSLTPPNNCGIDQQFIYGAPGLLGPSGGSTNNQYIERWYQNLNYKSNQNAAMEFELWLFFNSAQSSDPVITDLVMVSSDISDGTIKSVSSTLLSSCSMDYTSSSGVVTKAMYRYQVRVLFIHYWDVEFRFRLYSLFNGPSTTFSFGIRNFKSYLDDSISASAPLFIASFPCGSGSYWTGTACEVCTSGPNCGACTAAAPSTCLICGGAAYDYGTVDCRATCPLPFKATTNNGYPWTCQPTCPTTFFWYYNTSCTSACPAPFVSTTDSNNLKICSNPCYYNDGTLTLVNQYRYPDSTCLSTCPSPLVSPSTGLCVTPCPNVNDYVFQNGSCTSQCLSPLVGTTVNSIKYCNSPCSGQYIYLDGSCSTDCLAPLVKFDESADIKYCRTPCTDVNDYVFPNGTCTSQCPSLLVKSTVRKNNFCSSSCPNQYIYYDGSCSTDCVFPMVQRAESTIKFCVIPCANPQHYYYEVDQKCLPTCSDPYEVQQLFNLKICRISGNLNLNVEQVQETKAIVAGLTSANSAGAAGGKASASLSSTSPALAFLAGQVSLLFSVRYINVGYPDKVKLMFKLQGASPFSLSFDFNIPDGIEKKLVKRTPPEIFETYEVPSNFLENSWDTLMTLMLTLFSILVLSGVVRMMKGKCSVVGSILGGVLSFLKWNIPLMIFCSSFGDMYFFASLQFHSGLSGSTTWEVISFIIAILMVIIGLGVIIIPIKIARDLLKDQNSDKKWESFGLLFSGQKRTSLVSLCYMAFYLGVNIISNLIITNLYDYPLCEALLVTMISLIMFLFLVIQRPLKEHKMFAQVIINQLLLITVNVCVVILAIMDELEITRQDLRDKIGQAITMVFFCSMAAGIAFAVIEVLFTLFYLYKFLKKFKAEHGTLSPKRILQTLMSGGNQEKQVERTKFQRKLDLEQRRNRPSELHRQSTDLSLGGRGGKMSIQPPRKAKVPKKNPLNISYLDSNASGIDLLHQNSDYSFDTSGQPDLSPSPSKPTKSRLSNQQQRKNMLKNMNHQVLNAKSEYSLEVPPKQTYFKRARDVIAALERNNISQSPFENNKGRENISKQKRMIEQTAAQSQSPSRTRSSSPKRSNSQKRINNQPQVGKFMMKHS